MTKSQSNQAFKAASGTQATAGGNAQSSYNAAQGDITNYQDALAKYASENPYTPGGSFQTALNQETADTAAAGAQSAQQAAQAASVRAGQNPAAAIASGEQVREADDRALMAQQAQGVEKQAAGQAGYGQSVLGATALPAEEEAKLTSTELGGSNEALSSEQRASETPSFWQELGQASLNAGASFAGSFCPASGALILMADGTEKLIETIEEGEHILGIDGESQTVRRIFKARVGVVRIFTQTFKRTIVSWSHAFARPAGGFVEAQASLGEAVSMADGRDRIVGIEPMGTDEVFSIITDGSHTYRCDGFWSIGSGEMEMGLHETERMLTGRV